MITIENAFFHVEVNELGAELHSVLDKRTDQELLYQADSPAWAHQDVVLFPFIGPAKDYVIANKKYSCPTNHGFCRVKKFTAIQKGEDFVTLRLLPDADTKAVYPFDFVLNATYKLEKNSLRRSFQVLVKDGSTMPFALGDHAAYKAKFGSAVLHLGAAPLSYLPRPDGVLKEAIPFEHPGDYLLKKEDFKHYETIVLLNPRHPISLSTGYGERLTYHFHSPYIAIWSPSMDADFLCVEPWWGLPTYEGQSEEVAKRKDYNLVDKEALFEEKISFEVRAD
jgi:galactose mutarotase-like enzyme